MFVRGNGDRWVVDAFDAAGSMGEDDQPGRPGAAWTAAAIDRRDRDLLAAFAERVVLDIDGLGPTLFSHGSPRNDEELLTALRPERRWRPALEGVTEAVVVCGHTHMQFDRQLGPGRVMNAGAVGLPHEGRPTPTGCCSAPTSSTGARTTTSISAAAVMRARGNPDTDELLRESLVKPSDPRAVAELFKRQADGR